MAHRAPEGVVRVPEILSDLRLGMMTDTELAGRFREAEARPTLVSMAVFGVAISFRMRRPVCSVNSLA